MERTLHEGKYLKAYLKERRDHDLDHNELAQRMNMSRSNLYKVYATARLNRDHYRRVIKVFGRDIFADALIDHEGSTMITLVEEPHSRYRSGRLPTPLRTKSETSSEPIAATHLDIRLHIKAGKPIGVELLDMATSLPAKTPSSEGSVTKSP